MPRWPWKWPRAEAPIPSPSFPNLIPGKAGNHRLTSWSTSRYNCIAWAADDPMRPWWPGSISGYPHWPENAINEVTVPAFISAFQTLDYECCDDSQLEPGFEKIAIFAWPNGEPQHAARQLSDGAWTSKMGAYYWPDIRHSTLDAVAGPSYGNPVQFMKRKRKPFTIAAAFARAYRLARIFWWEATTFVKWILYGGTMYKVEDR